MGNIVASGLLAHLHVFQCNDGFGDLRGEAWLAEPAASGIMGPAHISEA